MHPLETAYCQPCLSLEHAGELLRFAASLPSGLRDEMLRFCPTPDVSVADEQ